MKTTRDIQGAVSVHVSLTVSLKKERVYWIFKYRKDKIRSRKLRMPSKELPKNKKCHCLTLG